jgi:L(+)-tartrate dehydratase beta subunit
MMVVLFINPTQNGLVIDMERELTIPLKKNNLKQLHIGDIVYLTGHLWTSRSSFAMRIVDEGVKMPIDTINNNVLLYAGPIVVHENNEWKIKAIAPTTGARFEKWNKSLITNYNLGAVISKGSLSLSTAQNMKDNTCVHLIPPGSSPVFASNYVSSINKVLDVYMIKELGIMEASWLLQVTRFGPLMVNIDTHGQIYYEEKNNSFKEGIKAAQEFLGIDNYEYQDII